MSRPEHPEVTEQEVASYLEGRVNLWGTDDERGAVNFITPKTSRQAAGLVRDGVSVSLSRDFPTKPGRLNPLPAQHYMMTVDRGDGAGAAEDYLGLVCHGSTSTHIDALCHMWDSAGMWNHRKPGDVIGFRGSSWGGIEHWKNGIVTRGVLLDVPMYRGEDFVTQESPVHGWELDEIVAAQDIELMPGDALVIYCGRDRWDEVNPSWGSQDARPGLHASCLPFLKASHCSTLVWDMMDVIPTGYSLPFTVHGALFAYGIALVDNAELFALVIECRSRNRTDFLFVTAPLVVIGGTGSPVNPLAVL